MDDVMQEFLRLRTAYDELDVRYNTILRDNAVKIEGLASLDHDFGIRYTYSHKDDTYSNTLTITWGEILKIAGPDLYSPSLVGTIGSNIKRYINTRGHRYLLSLNEMDVD